MIIKILLNRAENLVSEQQDKSKETLAQTVKTLVHDKDNITYMISIEYINMDYLGERLNHDQGPWRESE